MNMHPATATNPVRHSACAGRFYPADPRELRTLVETCLQTARGAAGTAPKAIIAPHAGYIYSGPIAGSAYARWRGENGRIRRVVVIGPSHFAEFAGLALSSAQAFETPLGRVPVDTDAIATIRAVPWVHTVDRAHAPEHCLEVQLPFLQVVLDEVSIVPLLVGTAADDEISDVLERLWNGSETRVVVSSDLSHYHDYLTALSVDAETARAIEELRLEAVDSDDACGCRPIRGLLRVARQHGLGATTVDLRNSGDTAGSRDRVVGYGAFLFAEPAAAA